MGLLKKKPGGTKAGNLLRSVLNNKLGTNLQPPVPLITPDAEVNPNTAVLIKPSKSVLGTLFPELSNVANSTSDAAIETGKTATWLRYGLIAVGIFLLYRFMKRR